MSAMKELTTKVFIRAIALSGLCCILSFFYFEDISAGIIGIILGTGVAILNYYILAAGMKKLFTMNHKDAKNFAVMVYIARYVLYGVILFLSVTIEKIDPIGTVIGIVSVQVAIHITSTLEKRAARIKAFGESKKIEEV